ncbi:MAG: hypothetical protein ABUL42_01085 [Terricaulis silvestris]
MVGENDGGEFEEASLYWEQPLTPRVAFVATPWYAQDALDTDDGWRAEANVGLKAALMRGDHGAMAVEAGATWRSDPDRACGEGGAELRWLGGASFGHSGQAFVNLEAAERVSAGGCESQRFELTTGYHASDRWLAMAQVFTEQRADENDAVLGQITLVRFHAEGRGVQLGFRARLDGDDSEPSLVLAFWGHPRD